MRRKIETRGINMSDEASETVAGGIRNFLGALGFIAPLIGAELLMAGERPPWIGWTLIVAGLPIYLSPAVWKKIVAAFRGQGQKQMAFAIIAAGAIGLAVGIYLLASNPKPVVTAAIAAPVYVETRIRLDREPGSDVNFTTQPAIRGISTVGSKSFGGWRYRTCQMAKRPRTRPMAFSLFSTKQLSMSGPASIVSAKSFRHTISTCTRIEALC
jgi:hypothetical protein